jgi:hypothetical protein
MAKFKQPHVIDYDHFLARLVEALRRAWTEVRAQRPDERFYLYGIGTDSDVVVMTPLCNTEEQFAREGNPRYPLDRWVVHEELYGAGRAHTSGLEDEVNHYILEDHRDDPDSIVQMRKERLLEVFEKTLAQLDTEGFFGSGKQRHGVLLKIDRGDCSPEEWQWTLETIRRLNPPESSAAFFAAVKQAEQQLAATTLSAERIAEVATEFLRQEKRAFERCLGAAPVRNEAMVPHLVKLLPGQRATGNLWQVTFAAKDEPDGRMHGKGVLVVLVDDGSGRCVIEP